MFPENLGKYILNSDEIEFLIALYNETLKSGIEPYLFTSRMADGTIDLHYKRFPVGRVRLQGRKHWIRIPKKHDSYALAGELDTFLSNIHHWISYVFSLIKLKNDILN